MAVWTEEQALRQLEVWGLVLWRWALKPLLYALIAAVLTGFVILASIELYPPFNSSPSADAIVASSESAEDTIETMRDASRKLRDDLRRAGAADLKACLNPKDPKAARTPSECVDDALAAVQTANSAFDAGLYKARNAIHHNLKVLRNASDASGRPLWILFDSWKRLLKWIGPVGVAGILSAALLGFALTRRSFWRYFRGKGTLTLPGGLVLNIDNLQAYRDDIKERYYELDKDISGAYKRKLSEGDFDTLFANAKAVIDSAFLTIRQIDLSQISHRSTLYVPGFLGDELIQATAYLGARFTATSGGIGRRFSVRYGIIGKSFRLRHSLHNPAVSSLKNNLIRHWGLTWKENARAGLPDQALIAFVLRSERASDNPLGVIYLESSKAGAFGAASNKPADAQGFYGDDVEVETLWATIRTKQPVIDLVAALEKLRGEIDWDSKLVTKEGR